MIRSVTVTIQDGHSRCQWCGVVFADSEGPGRPRRYCRRSHRQRAYEARRLGHQLGLRSGDVVVSAQAHRSLQDRLYVLEAALSDVERDLRGSTGAEEYRRAFQHLYAAAAALRGAAPEPVALLDPQ